MCLMHRDAKQTETSSLEQRKVYCRTKQGEWVACAQKTLNSPEGFSKEFLKVRWGRDIPGYVTSSCKILWLVNAEITGQLTLSILRCQKVRGLRAHDHQVVNFFHVVVFQHLKNSGNSHQILLSEYFREELQQRMGEGSVLGRPHRVLLGFISLEGFTCILMMLLFSEHIWNTPFGLFSEHSALYNKNSVGVFWMSPLQTCTRTSILLFHKNTSY